jgi:hypothetical protein
MPMLSSGRPASVCSLTPATLSRSPRSGADGARWRTSLQWSWQLDEQAGEDHLVVLVLVLPVVGGGVDASDVTDLHVRVLRDSDDSSPGLVDGAVPPTGQETDQRSDGALGFESSPEISDLLLEGTPGIRCRDDR